MSLNQRKTTTYALVQAAKAHRLRSSSLLREVGLHPGQDQILKSLADKNDQTMGALASALSVQPPTITKMVARLATQDLVERRQSRSDGRSSHVHLTEKGRLLIGELDERLHQMEAAALATMSEKTRKRLRKTLRKMEKNLLAFSQQETQ